MGAIQSSVNQLFGTVGVLAGLASQSPGIQGLLEKKQWIRDWKKLEGTEEALGLTKVGESGHHEVQPITSEQQALQAERVQGQRERFLEEASRQGIRNLSPSAVKSQVSNMQKIQAYGSALEAFRGPKPEEVMRDLGDKGLQEVNQKNSFNDFYKRLSLEEARPGTYIAPRGEKLFKREDR